MLAFNNRINNNVLVLFQMNGSHKHYCYCFFSINNLEVQRYFLTPTEALNS